MMIGEGSSTATSLAVTVKASRSALGSSVNLSLPSGLVTCTCSMWTRVERRVRCCCDGDCDGACATAVHVRRKAASANKRIGRDFMMCISDFRNSFRVRRRFYWKSAESEKAVNPIIEHRDEWGGGLLLT